ncbi:hypothetical protein HK098_005784 [Nowakowskiella sp. JEL0407]|nr:hypothetical protein HK098_005784 [Nowakowskiella sp. JEL0407]
MPVVDGGFDLGATLKTKLQPILLDLLHYDRIDLKRAAVQLIHILYSSTSDLLKLSKKSILLKSDEWIEYYASVQNNLDRLVVLCQRVVALDVNIKEETDSKVKSIQDFCDILDNLTSAIENSESRSLSQRILNNRDILTYILFVLKCRLTRPRRGGQPPPHENRQISISKSKASSHTSLNSNSSENAKDSSLSKENFQSQIFISIFRFLNQFSVQNEEHTNQLLANLNLLLDTVHPTQSDCSQQTLSECVQILSEMCTRFCSNRGIVPSQIKKLLEFASIHKTPGYIRLLKSLINPEDLEMDRITQKKNRIECTACVLTKKTMFSDITEYFNKNLSGRLTTELQPSTHTRESLQESNHTSKTPIRPRGRRKSVSDPENEAKRISLMFPVGFDILSASVEKNFAEFKANFTLKQQAEEMQCSYVTELMELLVVCLKSGSNNLIALCRSLLTEDHLISALRNQTSVALKTVTYKYLTALYFSNKEYGNSSFLKKSEASNIILSISKTLKEFGNMLRDVINYENDTRLTCIDSKLQEMGTLIRTGVFPCLKSLNADMELNTDQPESNSLQESIMLITSLYLSSKSKLPELFGIENSKERNDWVDYFRKSLEWCRHFLKSFRNHGSKINKELNRILGKNDLTNIDILELLLEDISSLKFSNSKSPQIEEQQCEDEILNRNFLNSLDTIISNSETKKYLNEEYENLVSLFRIQFHGTAIERDLTNSKTKQLICYLDKTVDAQNKAQENSPLNHNSPKSKLFEEKRISKDDLYDIKTLGILESLLQEHIEKLENCNRAADLDNWTQLEQKQRECQVELSRLGCTLMTEKILTSNRDQLSKAALKLLIALLDGGNKIVQSTLEEYWLGTREERFFYCIHNQIRQFIYDIRETKIRILDDSKRSSKLGNKPNLTFNEVEYSMAQDVMRLIQLLVEGHVFSLQNYVRNQPDNLKSFDLVKDVVEYLQAIVPIINEYNVALIVQVFDTLIDLSQGCTPNQVNIFNAKIMQPINQIFKDSKASMNVKGHASLSLLSLLEDDSDPDIICVMRETASTLDLEMLLKNLHEVQSQIKEATTAKNNSNSDYGKDADDIQDLKDTANLFTMLLITLLPVMTEEQQKKCTSSSAFVSISENIGRIEIVRERVTSRDRKMYSVLFPIPEICTYFRKDSKRKFLWDKKRTSPQEKVQDFVEQYTDMYFEIRNQTRIASNRGLTILANYFHIWWQMAYCITLCINVLNMMCMNDANHQHFSCSAVFYNLRTVLGFVHTVFWSLSSAEFMFIQFPLFYNRRKLKKSAKDKYRMKKHSNRWAPRTKQANKLQGRLEVFTNVQSQKEQLTDYLLAFLLEPSAIYHVLLLLSSIFGNFLHSALFSIHLLDFVYRDKVLQGVIMSVTLNWASLSKTGILGVIIVYVYAVVSFVFFRSSFDSGKGHFSILFNRVRSGGGVGDLLNVEPEQYGGRMFLDISFFFVVIVFLLNVIFGIIFDTFGQLREENQAIEQDLKTTCFICSIHSSEFERHAEGFEMHTRNDHNLWHYLYFFVHLKLKDPTEYTSHESYISEMLENQDLGFFPINRAMCLKHRDEEEDIEDRLKKLFEEKLSHPFINSAGPHHASNYNFMTSSSGQQAGIQLVQGISTPLLKPVQNMMKRTNSNEIRRRNTVNVFSESAKLTKSNSLVLPEDWGSRATPL